VWREQHNKYFFWLSASVPEAQRGWITCLRFCYRVEIFRGSGSLRSHSLNHHTLLPPMWTCGINHCLW
jgi:hypothetical protein